MEQIKTIQSNAAYFEQELILGNRTVTLTFKWNSRSEAWYMKVQDEDDFISAVKLVPNWPIIRQYKYLLPDFEGDFFIKKTDENLGDRITYDNLNNGYDLFYITEAEVESWEDFYGVG